MHPALLKHCSGVWHCVRLLVILLSWHIKVIIEAVNLASSSRPATQPCCPRHSRMILLLKPCIAMQVPHNGGNAQQAHQGRH